MFAFGQLYLAGQAGAIGALYWYASQMEADAVVSLGPVGDLRAREEPMVLWAVVLASALCFAASAWFQYAARNIVFDIAEEEIARGLGDVIRFARRLPDARVPLASRLLISGGLKSVSGGCRSGGMTVALLLVAVAPIVAGITAGVAMFWIDPVLTTLIMVALVLWSPSLYPLALKALKISTSRGRENQLFTRESRALLESPSATIPGPWESALKVAKVSLGKRRVSNEMSFTVQIGATVIGAVAAYYLASGLMSGRGEWPVFLAYLAIMRVAVNGLFAGPQTVAVVSRFYPQTALYVNFMRSAVQVDASALGRVQKGDAVSLGTLPNGSEVTVPSGHRIALASLADRPLIQAALLDATETRTRLSLNSEWLDVAAARSPAPDAPIALVEYAALATMARSDARAFLGAFATSVVLIVYRDVETVGAFDETQVITVFGGVLTASAALPTADSRAILESFTRACLKEREKAEKATAVSDDDELEDEEMMGE